MYINDKTDKDVLKRLWEARATDNSRMESGRLDDGCHFGLLFDSLFDDINDTLLFRQNGNRVEVCVKYNELPSWGPVGSAEAVYGNYSEEIKLKVEIIERIQLLKQLEEHRLAVWNYDGQDCRNNKPDSNDWIISFSGNEDADYLIKHINETLVPTRHLKAFIDNGFMDSDDVRNRRLLSFSAITTFVAIMTLLITIIK